MFRNYKFDKNDPSEKHSFEIYDVDISIINGIRRTILTDIPIPGIIGEDKTTVDIIKNTGPLHNEIMSHRIGLLPICLNEDEIESYNDNDIEIELNIVNNGNNILSVTSNDITVKKFHKVLNKKEIENIFPANIVTKSHILLTRLRSDEQLHFKANVVKKTARYNSAFCPVSLSNFFYMEDPEKASKKDNVLDKERSYYTNKYGEANIIQFELESINPHIGAKYLVSKAIKIIIDKFHDIVNNLLKEDYGNIKINKFQDLNNTYDITIQNEDDTVGNIIQSYIYNRYVRENNEILDGIHCSYIGYICPHPLKYELVIRITLEEQNMQNIFIQFLKTNCLIIINELININKEWNKFMNNK